MAVGGQDFSLGTGWFFYYSGVIRCLLCFRRFRFNWCCEIIVWLCPVRVF